MAKYSFSTRLQVILLLQEGAAIASVSRRTGISETNIRNWWFRYQHGGMTQLFHTNRAYTPEFKRQVLETKWRYRLSLSQTATRFHIPSDGLISDWERIVRANGWAGLLPKRKGRPKPMSKKKPTRPEPRARIQELEAEIERLQMENAFLKKLNALVQAREKKNTPKSSPN